MTMIVERNTRTVGNVGHSIALPPDRKKIIMGGGKNSELIAYLSRWNGIKTRKN